MRRRRLAAKAATAALLLAGGPVRAQEAGYAAQMKAINAAVPPPAPAAIAAAAREAIGKASAGRCAPGEVRTKGAPAPATADRFVTLAADRGTVRNGWTVTAMPLGCADARPMRLFVLALADGQTIAPVLNTGTSLAWPTLLRDIAVGAVTAAVRVLRANTCDARDLDPVVDARVTARGGDLGPDFYGVRYRGGWSETWTFRACGRAAEVPIAFRADGTGGASYSVSGEAVRLVAR